MTWTSEDAVLAALAIPDGQNLFTLDTTELSKRLASIPAIRGASITVALPDEVRVDVAERVALLAWQVGADRYLVDEDGMVFGRIDATSPEAAAKLPLVDDQRADAATIAVGGTLDPVILDAARRLGSLRPADLGTAASTARDPARRRPGLLAQGRSGRLVRGVRVLHADPAHDRPDPGPGPPPAQHARGRARTTCCG